MKVKTSITLSRELVRAVDRQAGRHATRSETIERLLREGLAARDRRLSNERDRALLDQHADELNAETIDVLNCQVDV